MDESNTQFRAFVGGALFTVVFVVLPMILGFKWKAILNGAWP